MLGQCPPLPHSLSLRLAPLLRAPTPLAAGDTDCARLNSAAFKGGRIAAQACRPLLPLLLALIVICGSGGLTACRGLQEEDALPACAGESQARTSSHLPVGPLPQEPTAAAASELVQAVALVGKYFAAGMALVAVSLSVSLSVSLYAGLYALGSFHLAAAKVLCRWSINAFR